MRDNSEFRPMVSIVMPVYNGGQYLAEAIDSALGQDYDNFEVIVVNDGSQDNSEDIVRSYGDRVRYFSKTNGGVSTALNCGIAEARGEYISWLSHDDLYFPNKISRQVSHLARQEDRNHLIVFSYFRVLNLFKNRVYDVRRQEPARECAPSRLDSLALLYNGLIHGCTLLIPKKAFVEVEFFNPELKAVQDYYLWFKLISGGYCFSEVNEPLIATRHHANQGTHAMPEVCRREEAFLFEFANKLFQEDLDQAGLEVVGRVLYKKGYQPPGPAEAWLARLLGRIAPLRSWRRAFRRSLVRGQFRVRDTVNMIIAD